MEFGRFNVIFSQDQNGDEVKIVTKIFDSDRDYQMTYFCSNLISNMVYYRKMAFDRKKDAKSQIAIALFGKDQISSCNKMNVEIQNLVYTVKKVKQ